MTQAILTTCSAEKSPAPGLLPARARYRGWWVQQAAAHAERDGLQLLILSGVLGIITAAHPVPLYDHALQNDEVEGMIAPTAIQLSTLRVVSLTALLLPEQTPGWAPYHRLLHAACQRANVAIQVILLRP